MTKKELQSIKRLNEKAFKDLDRRLDKRLKVLVDKKYLDHSLMKMVEEIFSPWPPY